ncbi:cation:proton antiporter [Dactylosporangium sp. NPDC051485]|uniref:cation:proton antiporter n=1 Tax=Dactylosporangium sp. NPDC051485 TaxID=3154846 RepID=UPI0034315B55
MTSTDISIARLAVAYLLLVGAAATAVVAVAVLHPRATAQPVPASTAPAAPVAVAVTDGIDIPHVLIVVAVLIAAAHLAGALAARLGQPRVTGLAAAGLLLGPSALGQVAPVAAGWLHSGGAATAVDLLAQLGVILFVFLIGRELGTAHAPPTRGTAVLVGHTTVAVPLLAGVVVAVTVLTPPAGVPALPHALFIGLAMAATALPVLAHILAERHLLTSPLGATGAAAAAVADATIWCLLAVTLCVARGESLPGTGLRLLAAFAFAAGMWWLLRPAVRRVLAVDPGGSPVRPALLLCLVLGCAVATERLGLHAIFGAFLAGLIMPVRSATVTRVAVMAQGATEWLLLPLFFTAIGSRTHLSLLTGPTLALAGLVVAVAVSSKLLSGAVAGRVIGYGWRDATALGVMLNCRGLTELVLLSLGRTAGIIDERTFTVFVVMALVTTAATGPLLNLVGLRRPAPGNEPAGQPADQTAPATPAAPVGEGTTAAAAAVPAVPA